MEQDLNRNWEQETEHGKTVKTEEKTDRKCPRCGGVMDFNPANGRLHCPYCDYEEEIEKKPEKFIAKELDFNLAEEQASCDWGMSTKTVICKSCGARTVYDASRIAGECPYCGSNQIMEAAEEHVMAPGGVVVFRVDAKLASERFRSWIGKKFFCPRLAKESAKPAALKGLYVPYWTFDTSTSSRYYGEYGINRIERGRDGKPRTVTHWFRTSGSHQEKFDDVLVCGASGQNENMIVGLEPYDTSQVEEYRPEYLAGFTAERYTVKMKTAWEKARGKIAQILRGNVESRIRSENGADLVRNVSLNTEYREITYKYLLLPVWISSFQYNNKIYHFMVNGQTGRVSGSTPVSWVKVVLVAAAAVAVVGMILYLSGF